MPLSMVNMVSKHFQNTNTLQILFVDFTAVFNTIQTHILLQQIIDLGVDGGVGALDQALPNRPHTASVCEGHGL